MISKVFSGHSFFGAVKYVCKDEQRATILAVEGVRSHNYKLMAQDFISQQQLRPSKEKACFHSILSFYPGENPSDETMVEIAQKYLRDLGIVNTQYAITKHTDKAHLHIHIIANMVNNDGKSINDSWIGLKGKRVAQQLTQEYKLVPAIGKKIELTNLKSLSQSEANKYKVYQAITDNLPLCKNMQELETRLLKLGIETQYKYKGQTQEKQGVSFKIGKDCFKGSKVDRKFSLGNLEKTMLLQQQHQLKPSNSNRSPYLQKLSVRIPESSRVADLVKVADKTLKEGVKDLIYALTKPEYTEEGVPKELLEEARRMQKKRQRDGWHL